MFSTEKAQDSQQTGNMRLDAETEGWISSTAASAEVDPLQMDKLIAKEIEGLSLKERNALYEEIHGVSTMAPEESPELIHESLDTFQQELGKMDTKSMQSYNIIANNQDDRSTFSRNMIQGDEFRLRFLRSEFFDAKKAARRMLHFLDILQELWGEDELKGFDGTMDFFLAKDSEQASFRMGLLQLLPFRDRSGRKIQVHNFDSMRLENITRVSMCGRVCVGVGGCVPLAVNKLMVV